MASYPACLSSIDPSENGQCRALRAILTPSLCPALQTSALACGTANPTTPRSNLSPPLGALKTRERRKGWFPVHWLTPMASRLPPLFGAKDDALRIDGHWARDFSPNAYWHSVPGSQPPRGCESPLVISVSWWGLWPTFEFFKPARGRHTSASDWQPGVRGSSPLSSGADGLKQRGR